MPLEKPKYLETRWLTSLLKQIFVAVLLFWLNERILVRMFLFLPFLIKLNFCEIYFISEPENLIPKKMNLFLGKKTDSKLA